MPVHAPPPGIKRTSWSRKRRRVDAAAQQRRWRNRNAIVNVPRNRLNFPQSQRTTLRYCTPITFDLTGEGTGIKQFQFRANGMFDPDVGQGGHQPRGFDEYMSIYNTFTVLGCSISVNWVFQGYQGPTTIDPSANALYQTSGPDTLTPAACPVIVGIHKGLEILAAGAVQTQMEKDRTSWVVLLPTGPSKTQTSKLLVSDFYGKQKLVGSAGFTGDKTQDPSEQVYFEIFAGRATQITGGATSVTGYCTLQYDAVFTEPKTLTQS